MQLYLADIQFDDIDMQKAAYAQFIELWESGAMAKEDKFEGFEMLFRVHAPGEGRVVVLCRAESDKQLFAQSFAGLIRSKNPNISHYFLRDGSKIIGSHSRFGLDLY